MKNIEKSNFHMWQAAIIVGFLFAMKFGILMYGSVIFGRLAMPPVYDDVTYFTDAMERIQVFESGGLWAVMKQALVSPPHSPFSTLSAGFAFLVIGPYRAGAYFMNVVSLFLITMFWVRVFSVPTAVAALFGAIIISTGWFDSAVTIFHPDLVMGFGAAVVAATLVFQSEVLVSFRRLAAAGSAAGFAPLTKPAAFAAVLAFLCVAVVMGGIAGRMSSQSFRTLGIRLSVFAGAMLIVCGTYYAFHLVDIIKYMYLALVSQRDVWDSHLTLTEHLLYFFYRAFELFHFWGWLGLILITSAAGLAGFKGDKPAALRFGGLLVCGFAAYAIPTVPTVKTMLFGMLFYGMIVMFIAIGLLCLQLEAARLGRNATTICAAFLLFIAALTFADKQPHFPESVLIEAGQEYKGVYAFIKQQREDRSFKLLETGRLLKVVQPTLVDVPAEAYEFRALQDGFKIAIHHFEFEGKLQTVLAALADADVIVVPDAALAATLFHYPVIPNLNAFREGLPALGFSQQGSVSMPAGTILLYAREEPKP